MAEKLFAGNVKSQKSLHYIKVESGVGTASKVSQRSTSRTDDGEGVIKDDSGKKQRFHTDLKTGFGIVAARAHFPLSPFHLLSIMIPRCAAPQPMPLHHMMVAVTRFRALFSSLYQKIKVKGEQSYGFV